MNTKTLLLIASLCLIVFSVGIFGQQYSYDYENMKMEEYSAELSKWQQREADANAAIADEEEKISQLEGQIAGVDQEISDCWSEIYSLLETDEAGYNEFIAQAKSLEDDLSAFTALSPEELYSRRDELDNYRKRLQEMRSDKRSLGPEPYQVLQRVENLIAQAEEKAKPAAAGRYEVNRGDYLWKIAKMPDIYGDPYAWIRIYTSNRDQIKNPDLIYPQQIFRVPRAAGPDEHWVSRGQNLAEIAKSLGSPFTWQKIYDANKEVISDPNLIYPHMVLKLPQ